MKLDHIVCLNTEIIWYMKLDHIIRLKVYEIRYMKLEVYEIISHYMFKGTWNMKNPKDYLLKNAELLHFKQHLKVFTKQR